MYQKLFLFCLLLLPFFCLGQSPYFPFDTLKVEQIKLEQIDIRYGNTYRYDALITDDSVFLCIAPGLPRGYYEAYYDGDTNRLALTYYHFGRRSYVQQYYKDGAMKSDTEYDRYGFMHGLHVLYNREGDEVWHADYYHGALEEKYTLEFAEIFNYAPELIEKGKAWGCYEFSPTPMRERHDQINLRADGTFSYYNLKADCDCRRYSEGTWTLEGKFLRLKVDKKEVWGTASRLYAIITTQNLRWPRLVEVLPWGLNWYGSEYWWCKNCTCLPMPKKDASTN